MAAWCKTLADLPLRYQRVARLTVDGASKSAVAAETGVSPSTVERMRTFAYRAFGVQGRFELAALVPDAKLNQRKRLPCHGIRSGISLRAEETLALNRVLSAIDAGRDVRVLTRDPMYRRARAVLVRAAETAKKKLANNEVEREIKSA